MYIEKLGISLVYELILLFIELKMLISENINYVLSDCSQQIKLILHTKTKEMLENECLEQAIQETRKWRNHLLLISKKLPWISKFMIKAQLATWTLMHRT